jgi:hypothetical protein
MGILILCTIFVGVGAPQIACQPSEPLTNPNVVPKADMKFMRQYNGNIMIPDDLLAAYNTFADAAKKADGDSVSQLILPHAIRMRAMMDRANTETPEDICLWRLGDKFSPDIMAIRKDASDCYLIRTASCATWWVHTKNMGWKLYQYQEKPIKSPSHVPIPKSAKSPSS